MPPLRKYSRSLCIHVLRARRRAPSSARFRRRRREFFPGPDRPLGSLLTGLLFIGGNESLRWSTLCTVGGTGKFDFHGRAVINRAFDRNGARMIFHNAARDWQTQT